jgi:hypothetical protein
MSEEFDDLYGSNFLAATDLKKPITTVIEQIEYQDFARQGERKKMKAVLYLRGLKKPVVCNKTNALTLRGAFGDFDDWIDQRIVVKAEDTMFGGKPVKGLRLYPANGENTSVLKAPKSKKASDEELNDDTDDI